MTRGRLVLAGSGEFTESMADLDREILGSIGRSPTVAIVPTASGLEETPQSWIEKGCEHFLALGANPVPVTVLRREDAHERRWSDAVSAVDWIYFSGGSPGHAIATLEGTPFWKAVEARHRDGAVLAGSSAGAMMLGEQSFLPEDFDEHGLPRKVTMSGALGLLRGIFIFPHFDIIPESVFRQWTTLWPDGLRLLAIDEDTAIVEGDGGWTVHGRGRAQLLRAFGDGSSYRSGARLGGIEVT